MSRHNRARRRPGVLKAARLAIAPAEYARANLARQAELRFYRRLAAAQAEADADGATREVVVDALAATVYPQPDHWTPRYAR